MTTAENYELLGKTLINANHARNEGISEEYDTNDKLEVLEFEDSSRLNIQLWTEVK